MHLGFYHRVRLKFMRSQSVRLSITWKAQQQWYAMYHRRSLRRGPQITVVAVARALVGYLWAVMRDLAVATAPLAAVHIYC